MCESMYSWFSVFVIMHQIHSRRFQICGIDEYWRIPFMEVSSRDYSSVYARMPENVDEYLVFAYSRLFSKNWCMCGSTLIWRQVSCGPTLISSRTYCGPILTSGPTVFSWHMSCCPVPYKVFQMHHSVNTRYPSEINFIMFELLSQSRVLYVLVLVHTKEKLLSHWDLSWFA